MVESVDEQECPLSFEGKKHTSFWLRHLRMLPGAYQSADLQRMTIAYFALSALDLLNQLDSKVENEERLGYIDWIYDQQLNEAEGGGFAPGPYLPKANTETLSGEATPGSRRQGNLAMTYTAIMSLAILKDDFSRLNKSALYRHLHTLQQNDGSFAPSLGQEECDCRFVFCAFAVCHVLDAWSAIDVEKAIKFLLSSQSYDCAFGQGPHQESHSGSTYCVISALSLAGRLQDINDLSGLVTWLCSRQQSAQGGFNGRIEKVEDACYSFWCGASLTILGHHSMLDVQADILWLLQCQSGIGGISKTPDEHPDAMHAYLGLAALAMHVHEGHMDENHLRGMLPPRDALPASLLTGLPRALDPRLNITFESRHWLQKCLPCR